MLPNESETEPRGVRRVVARLAIEVAAAGVLTVLVSWSCSWWSLGEQAAGHFGFMGTGWIREVPIDWPDEPNGTTLLVPRIGSPASGGLRAVGVRWRERQGMHHGVSGSPGGPTSFLNDDPTYAVDVVESGWPWRTMAHVGPTDTRPGLSGWARGIGVPEVKPLWLKVGRRLPLVPVWPGFLWSVLAWAGVLELTWQLRRLPGRVRHRRRHHSGRCLRCGYELAGLERCPECNTPSERGEGVGV